MYIGRMGKWVILLATVFVVALRPSFDTDLGWHLRYGEHFWNTGQVQRDNPYSTALPDFRWTNISWGLDVIDYGVHHYFGFAGLSVLSAGAIALAYFLSVRAFTIPFFAAAVLLPVWWWVNSPLFNSGWRGQVLSTLYVAILALILTRAKKNPKIVWLLPAFFCLWSNTHGTFVMGLGLAIMWLMLQVVKEKMEHKNARLMVVILGISTLAAGIHPFGIDIFKEALSFASNPSLTKINEWKSPIYVEGVAIRQIVWTALITLGLAVMFLKKEFRHTAITVGGLVLLLLSWKSLRYLSTMTIFTLPVAAYLVQQFVGTIPKNLEKVTASVLVVSIGLWIKLVLPGDAFWSLSWPRYCVKYVACSTEVAEYILDHRLNNDKLFTIYGLGGWLIWNYPEIKTFVDGRMHLWQKDGLSPFEEYYALEMNTQSIDESRFDSAFIVKTKFIYPELERLVASGKWTKEIETATTALYTRKKKSVGVY